MAGVYGIYNDTKRERYYGTTKRKMPQRLGEHESGQTVSLQHWNWNSDKIRTRTIAKGSIQKKPPKRHMS